MPSRTILHIVEFMAYADVPMAIYIYTSVCVRVFVGVYVCINSLPHFLSTLESRI
jgi:hypothetical protein